MPHGPTSGQPIRLHPLSKSEFELLGRWLSEPVVARWWNHETSACAVERDFGPAVDGLEPTSVLIAEIDATPFGLIQHYPIAADPDYLAELTTVCQLPGGAVCIDYLIGVAALRGRGLGAAMIAAGLEVIWAERTDASVVIVAVHAENLASWRALERAGFTRVAAGELRPDDPRDSRDHYVYGLNRPAP